jgi:UDP-glucuronate 4-epimerase
MKVLVTGAAGFIGFHMVKRLLKEGFEVVGIDNLSDYYNLNLKFDRLKDCGIIIDNQWIKDHNINDLTLSLLSLKHPSYRFIYGDIANKSLMMHYFEHESFDYVINLAAQAGVRYSLVNPDSYIHSNILGFQNLLECTRQYPVKHFIYASSSSVYGNSINTPFNESDITDAPVSLYAATKKSNELTAFTYNYLFNIPFSGLRFFTVYGPWGRPDMAYYSFAKAIVEGKAIPLFNGGDMYRDFTYIDDIVESIVRLLEKIPVNELGKSESRIFNIGASSPIYLKEFISILENNLHRSAIIENKPMQETDVYKTFANTLKLKNLIGYTPKTNINEGLNSFCNWFQNYEKIK